MGNHRFSKRPLRWAWLLAALVLSGCGICGGGTGEGIPGSCPGGMSNSYRGPSTDFGKERDSLWTCIDNAATVSVSIQGASNSFWIEVTDNSQTTSLEATRIIDVDTQSENFTSLNNQAALTIDPPDDSSDSDRVRTGTLTRQNQSDSETDSGQTEIELVCTPHSK